LAAAGAGRERASYQTRSVGAASITP